MHDSTPADPSAPATVPTMGDPRRVWVFRGLLGLFVAYLLVRAWQARVAPFVHVDWAFESSDAAIAWFSGLVRREIVQLVWALILGLLTPPASEPLETTPIRWPRWQVWLGWAGFGLTTIALCLWIAWGEFPRLGSLFLPWACFLVGVRLSSAALEGRRALAWAAGQLGVLLLLLAVSALVLTRMAISSAPMEMEARMVEGDAKRQLAQRIRDSRAPEDQPRTLHLTDAELNSLMHSVLGRGGAQRKAAVHFEPETIDAQASLALPRRFGGDKFINARMQAHLAIDDGHLRLGVDALQVGSVRVPGFLLRIVSSSVHALLLDDPQIHRIIEAIVQLNMESGSANVAFRPGALARQVIPSLVQLLWERPDVAHETGVQLRNLVAVYDRLGPNEDRFGKLMQAAFQLAAQRSRDHSPVLENRAAIFALAILLGHPDLEPFVGEVFDPELQAKAHAIVNTVTLRGRQDWPRHFWVSAALVLLSNESTSDRVGMIKEKLDSREGGSGFSFADALANMAGTRLAVAAVRNDASARAVQKALAAGPPVDAYFPPADGLPEDIPAAEFQSKYGGLNGAGYREQLGEINRRLEALPAWSSPLSSTRAERSR